MLRQKKTFFEEYDENSIDTNFYVIIIKQGDQKCF